MYKYIKTKIPFSRNAVSVDCDVSTNFEIQQEIPPALSLFSTWRLCSGKAKRKQESGNVIG